jgi:hypothetical protein
VGDHLGERDRAGVAGQEGDRTVVRLQILASGAHYGQAPAADDGGVERFGSHVDERPDLHDRARVTDHRRRQGEGARESGGIDDYVCALAVGHVQHLSANGIIRAVGRVADGDRAGVHQSLRQGQSPG